MSTAMAIGTVSAVLKNLLDNIVVDATLTAAVGKVKVSAFAPDQVKPTNADPVWLNLFLYHVEPNAAWRNVSLPSRDGGGDRTASPPLALDLYYLLSAYGTQDFQAEIVLGYAAQLLHEVPVLTRQAIRRTFTPAPVNAPLKQLAAAALDNQVEQIKIVPHAMNSEESAKLWAATQTNYRPSIAYQVSVVLIEAEHPTRTALPVLRREAVTMPDVVPPYPTLIAVTPPKQQPSIRSGEMLTLVGHDLDGPVVEVRFDTARRDLPHIVPASSASFGAVTVRIPNAPADWPAGPYNVAAVVTPAGRPPETSNALPVALAPELVMKAGPAVDGTAARDGNGNVSIHLKVRPDVLPEQRASLIAGNFEAPATERNAVASDLAFVFPAASAPPAGDYLLRLRVDGVESLLVDRDVVPPQFDQHQKITIP